jgi:hypothetical protein
MKDNVAPIEVLFERVEDYGKTSLELIRLKTIDKTAEVVSTLVSRLAVYIAVTLSALIINVGIALYIGQLLANMAYGFFIVGAFYAFVAVLLSIFRNAWIKHPLNDSIITQLLKSKVA